MRSRESQDKDFFVKTFRIRPDALEAYKYLEFLATKGSKPKDTLFETIILFGLDYFSGKKLSFHIDNVSSAKPVKGFSVTTDTLKNFMDYKDMYASHLFIGDLVEIFITLYALKHLDQDDLSKLCKMSWYNNLINV